MNNVISLLGSMLCAWGVVELTTIALQASGTFSTKKIGGLRFVRLGRLSMSFCVCKPKGLTGTELVAQGYQRLDNSNLYTKGA